MEKGRPTIEAVPTTLLGRYLVANGLVLAGCVIGTGPELDVSCFAS